MEGHTTQRNSQLHLHHVYVSQSENCEVTVEGRLAWGLALGMHRP
jgi:hypothetical protein